MAGYDFISYMWKYHEISGISPDSYGFIGLYIYIETPLSTTFWDARLHVILTPPVSDGIRSSEASQTDRWSDRSDRVSKRLGLQNSAMV